MEEIFLQDYANNVAQAQDPFGVAAVQAQPGFENYVPSFQNQIQPLEPMGFAPQEQKVDLGQIGKDMAVNVLKNQAIKKLGLKSIEGNILSGALGFTNLANPIGALYTVGSLLPDNVKGIAEVLRSKRADKIINKAIKRDNERDTQGDIKTINLQNTGAPSAQDKRRTEQYSTEASKKSSPARQERHSAGVGGLHSGY